MSWSPVAIKIARRRDDDRANGTRERGANHVPFELFAQPDPGVDPFADDVDQISFNAQIEGDFGIEPEKLGQDRLNESAGGDTRCRDGQPSRWSPALLAGLLKRGIDLAE